MQDKDGFLTAAPTTAGKNRPQSGSLAAMLENPERIRSAVRSSGHQMPVPVIEGAAADAVVASSTVATRQVESVATKSKKATAGKRPVEAGAVMELRVAGYRPEKVTVVRAIAEDYYRVVTKSGRAFKVKASHLY